MEILRIFDRDFGGHRQLARGIGQAAIAQARVGGGVDHLSVFGAKLRFCDAPLLCGGIQQHVAGGCAGLAQRIPAGADAHAAEGALQRAVGRIDGCEFGANLLPIAIQLFGQQLRERSHRPLAHLRFVDREQ